MTESKKTMVDYASVSMTTVAGSGPDATNIVVQMSLDVTQPQDVIDAALDKWADSLDRQRIIGEIPAYMENIDRAKRQISQMEDDRDRLDKQAQKDWEKSGRNGKVKHSPANEKNRIEVALNIKKLQEQIQENIKKLDFAMELKNGKKGKAVKSA
jgi:hypothetical protein